MAYTLNVIQDMLEKIPEPARTLCETAAFNHGALLIPDPAEAEAAMEKFGRVLDPKWAQTKNTRRSKKSRRPHKH